MAQSKRNERDLTQIVQLLHQAYSEASDWMIQFERRKGSWKRTAYQVKALGNYVYVYICYINNSNPRGDDSVIKKEYWHVYRTKSLIESALDENFNCDVEEDTSHD